MEIQVLLPKANGKVEQPEYKPAKQNKLYSILTLFCHLSRHYLPIPKTNAAWRLKTPLVYLLNPSLVYLNLYHQICVCVCVCKSLSRSTLCDPMDCSHQIPLPMGILQARILEWVAMPSSRVSSQPRDWTQASHIASGFLTSWATREAPITMYIWIYFVIGKFLSACCKDRT